MSDEPVRLDARVIGRVQGVGFRYFVLDWAAALQLQGWVANESDGSVRCVAEGPRSSLDRLVDRLREGPGGARVDRVEDLWLPASGGFDGFRVRSGAHRGD